MRLTLLCLVIVLISCSKENSTNSQAPSSATEPNPAITRVQPGHNATLIRDQISEEGKQLLLKLYGGTVWKNQTISKYFDGVTEAYITPKFEARFTENGHEKLLVLGYIAPSEEYFCHACVPLLGGAILRNDNSAWIVENKQLIIGWGDVLGAGEFQLVQIGADKYGISVHVTDAHQGYEDNRYLIILPYKGGLSIALDSGFIEKPGEGAYISDNVGLSEQSASISFPKGSNPDYFDVELKLNYNEGEGEKWQLKSEVQHYIFKDGQYTLLDQAVANNLSLPISTEIPASSPTPTSSVISSTSANQ